MIKKLLRFAGGQPVRSKDLEFIQEALNASTVEFAKAFGTTYILYGTVNADRTSVTAGAVVINGEVYKVPALGALGDNKLCFRATDSDERTFYNKQKHKVIRTYEAYLSADTSGASAYIDLKTAKRINEDLENLLSTQVIKRDGRINGGNRTVTFDEVGFFKIGLLTAEIELSDTDNGDIRTLTSVLSMIPLNGGDSSLYTTGVIHQTKEVVPILVNWKRDIRQVSFSTPSKGYITAIERASLIEFSL